MKKHFHLHWSVRTDQTCVLNLDSAFDPFLERSNLLVLDYKKSVFKGGEPLFQITTDTQGIAKDLIITQRFNAVADLVDIVVAVDAARRLGFQNISLVLPYFPAARQDRVCNEGESLTVKVFADMINACEFSSVTILTPHSDVTPALINNVNVLDETTFANDAFLFVYAQGSTHEKEFNVVCPDGGAGKRVAKIASTLSKAHPTVKFNLIRCEKLRNVVDGSLTGFFVQADDLGGHPTIIFDDCVAMGGTFLGLGEILKQKNCGSLSLCVSHADCVEGLQKMTAYFDQVFVTNSKKDWDKQEGLIDDPNLVVLTIGL